MSWVGISPTQTMHHYSGKNPSKNYHQFVACWISFIRGKKLVPFERFTPSKERVHIPTNGKKKENHLSPKSAEKSMGIWTNFPRRIMIPIHQGKSRWHRKHHVLVYIPVFNQPFGERLAMYFGHGVYVHINEDP